MHVQAQISIGPRVGINLSNQRYAFDDESESLDNRVGFLAGLVVEGRFSDNLALQAELDFIQKGAKDNLFSGDAQLILNYLEIPILFKAGGSFDIIRLDGLIGPSIGFGIGDVKIKQNGETESSSWDEYGINTIDFGLQFGGAISVKAGRATQIFLDIRYVLGLSNLIEMETDDTLKNRGLGISIGALFAL